MKKMNTNISLHIPAFEELWYREKLLSDADTMNYNKGYNIDNQNYCRETGCINFPKQEWEGWYRYFIGHEPERYYAYITRNGIFIGEVNAHKHGEAMHWYNIGIVIEAKHRGQGYAAIALKLLLKQAFETLGAQAVHNSFEETRISAIRAHLSAGFEVYKKEDGIIELLITRKQYSDGFCGG